MLLREPRWMKMKLNSELLEILDKSRESGPSRQTQFVKQWEKHKCSQIAAICEHLHLKVSSLQ